MFESWKDIRKYREEKGISLFTLSEKMRLPEERIKFLEEGNFTTADPVITRLQLKNYAQHLGLNYDELIELSGLSATITELPKDIQSESLKIKKTHAYRGRKKEPSKLLIYCLIVVGIFAVILLLNKLSTYMNINTDLFEMTEQQRSALDTPMEHKQDSTLFRPVLPQIEKPKEDRDIIEDMSILNTQQVRFPVRLNIFPNETISYRHEIRGENPKEDLIIKDLPKSLTFSRSGRMIFYNTENTRFVLSDYSFRDNDISRVVIDIEESGTATIYTK